MKYPNLKFALAVSYFLCSLLCGCYVVLDVVTGDGDTTQIPLEVTIDSTYNDTALTKGVEDDSGDNL